MIQKAIDFIKGLGKEPLLMYVNENYNSMIFIIENDDYDFMHSIIVEKNKTFKSDEMEIDIYDVQDNVFIPENYKRLTFPKFIWETESNDKA